MLSFSSTNEPSYSLSFSFSTRLLFLLAGGATVFVHGSATQCRYYTTRLTIAFLPAGARPEVEAGVAALQGFLAVASR